MILFTARALLTAPLAIHLPEAETVVLFNETFLMALVIMHGTAACVVATACNPHIVYLTAAKRVPLQAILFDISDMVCEAFLYCADFQLTEPTRANGIAARVQDLAGTAHSCVLEKPGS